MPRSPRLLLCSRHILGPHVGEECAEDRSSPGVTSRAQGRGFCGALRVHPRDYVYVREHQARTSAVGRPSRCLSLSVPDSAPRGPAAGDGHATAKRGAFACPVSMHDRLRCFIVALGRQTAHHHQRKKKDDFGSPGRKIRSTYDGFLVMVLTRSGSPSRFASSFL